MTVFIQTLLLDVLYVNVPLGECSLPPLGIKALMKGHSVHSH